MTKLSSWIESANSNASHFPIHNLPYGVFSTGASAPRCGTAIGDFVLDLAKLESIELIRAGGRHDVFGEPSLNAFMALGQDAWHAVRSQLTALLAADSHQRDKIEALLVPRDRVTLHMPIAVTEYTDFYAGRHHAENVGTMLRGADQALPPNWLHMPIAYNGRASTVVVDGTPIHRPLGQLKPRGADVPHFGPSRRLDFELEMGAIVGSGNRMGEPVTLSEAHRMIFGYVLLNDWSARDIQGWEYQPLGPFQAKAFATTISPWVVTAAALAPFLCETPAREVPLLPYLRDQGPMLYDVHLQAHLQPEGAARATCISQTNYKAMYYSAAQQLCHHAIGGCRMNCGDLLGTGTISGPGKAERGSMLELSWGGREPLTLEDGVVRTFLEDGDTVTLTGFAEGDGYRVGFGQCTGKILPSPMEKDWMPGDQHA